MHKTTPAALPAAAAAVPCAAAAVAAAATAAVAAAAAAAFETDTSSLPIWKQWLASAHSQSYPHPCAIPLPTCTWHWQPAVVGS